MVILFISSLTLVALLACGAIMLIHRAYYRIIDGLRSDIKDLRDRLFQKNALPPSGVNLTEKYEARQERINTQQQDPNRGKKALGPIEKFESEMRDKDHRLVERKNIDATIGRLN